MKHVVVIKRYSRVSQKTWALEVELGTVADFLQMMQRSEIQKYANILRFDFLFSGKNMLSHIFWDFLQKFIWRVSPIERY